MEGNGRGDGASGTWLTTTVREFIVKLLVSLMAGVFALWFAVGRLDKLGLRPTELSMSPNGIAVKMDRQVPGGHEYFMAVPPQIGWLDTDIPIAPDDHVVFWASGEVNLSLFRITESVQNRKRVEGQITCMVGNEGGTRSCTDPRARRFADSLEANASLTPEDFFTTAEVASMEPSQPWVGPAGDSVTQDRSYAGRTAKKLAPDLAFGQLIGLILPKDQDPDRQNSSIAFSIGSGVESEGGQRAAKRTGDLWLAVNDVWNGSGKLTGNIYPDNMFVLDNIGTFWVRVTVTKQ
jgi:hypothetical protein